ncbi:hypothetical protein AQUSIP_18280 [Aquicella siphonis]|uniref:Uncharacterized protein n=1 Tax=Aquicella siphonis TaxID=254247 RepID=A0A5E4PIW7_9COXI|nr:hypothetical protein [Aquicella siphonis]VVC76515.1 hypothetical protein AQUSIP_18280 [Aquicella siphonis]
MRKQLTASLTAICLCASAWAATAPHTWHTVTSDEGVWDARLQMINQDGGFEARDGSALSAFTISPGKPQEYGFSFAKNADFDVAYTLTLTQRSSDRMHFSSKACVYVVTASGPARPDIRASSFNGAICEWKTVPGVGEDFIVS